MPKLFCGLIMCMVAGGLFAQGDRGTVTGTVADPSGAGVPKASVDLRNSATGVEFKTLTTGTGNFALTSIPAGEYELTVTSPGFSKAIQQNIQVQVALTVRIDLVLKVGANEESVTVTAE
ncbi:MAG: carboxypeptidase-like regulatory domain-containing protein, partial [Roseimicrobium sp.]